jgi:AcrR family transcriptional regulator
VSAAAPKLKLADGADQRARGRPGTARTQQADKLRRIKDAARGLFLAKGFEDTTTREIAIRAGVGIGTIFVYAENKRDLLGA